MRQSGLAGVGPGGEPVGADIGGGVGELVDERGRGLIVKVVEVFVVIGLYFEVRVAVGEQDGFEQAVGAQANVEGVIRGIVDEGGVIGAHGKKGRQAIDQCGAKALIDSGLAGEVAVEIVRGVEGIVGFGDVKGQDSSVEFHVLPVAEPQWFGELLTVHADFPGKQTGGIDFGLAELADCGFVAARERLKGEAVVFIEANEMIVTQAGIFCFGFKRLGDVLQDKRAIVVEINAKFAGQRINRLIDDQLVGIASPGASSVGKKNCDQSDG